MIPAIIIGRKGSKGLPGKNTMEVLGKKLAEYPMDAALEAVSIDKVFLSTDDELLKELAEERGISLIDRPERLATSEALGEDVFKHAFEEIVRGEGVSNIEMVVLLFCNAPTVSARMLDGAIKLLREEKDADSVVSASRFNMWSPIRARKIDEKGHLQPFIPFEVFGDPASLNCDRDSQGDVWYADMSLSVVRPNCLENMDEGLLPQKWMGQKILPYRQEFGCDIDYEWQVPMVKWWLENEQRNG